MLHVLAVLSVFFTMALTPTLVCMKATECHDEPEDPLEVSFEATFEEAFDDPSEFNEEDPFSR